MYCRKCGRQINEGEKFCKNCGTMVDLPPQSQQELQTDVEVAVEEKPEGENNGRKRILTILTIVFSVILVIEGIAGVMIYQKRQTKNKTGSGQIAENERSTESEKKLEETEDAISENTLNNNQDTASKPEVKLNPEEQNLSDRIHNLNGGTYNVPVIDVYAENYKPADRNTDAVWNQDVFYQMEGINEAKDYYNKNLCNLIKKQLWTKSDGHLIEYEVYLNPDTSKPNKIVSLEYLDSGLEIVEYYYTNDAKANFVFQYKTDNYVSCYAIPDMAGTRFLFDNDRMTTWREVSENGDKLNYVIGQSEAERVMSGGWEEKTIKIYASLDDEMKDRFDTLEKRMLNAAYNTYHQVMGAEGVAVIRGYVRGADDTGLPEISVNVFADGGSNSVFTANTGAEGDYTIYVPNDAHNYHLSIGSGEYNVCDIYDIEINSGQVEADQDIVYLFPLSAGESQVELKLGDALNYSSDGMTMEALAGAMVTVRQGINNKTGNIIGSYASDSAGALLVNLPAGVYTLEIAAEGYANMYFIIVSNPQKQRNFYEIYATPNMAQGELRIVLTWGEEPHDLDSHLFTISGYSESEHIWFGNQRDWSGSDLDVDDTDSYGPETTTIRNFDRGNYYKYCVADYTNCSNGYYDSEQMSYSNACVNVYTSEGLAASFHVPTARPGVIWEVFEVRNGRITPIQRYYDTVEDKTWWAHE